MKFFKGSKSCFSKSIIIPSLLVLFILSLLCAFYPDATQNALGRFQQGIYKNLSWTYILLVSFFVIFQLVLALSKFGNIRLGSDNSKPQYGFFSWIAMLFAAGMGIGLMYYGVAEPMSHYVSPAIPGTENPAKEAQLATFFHWGVHAWSIFGIMGLILAYFSFRYKLPLAVRSGFYPFLKDKINGPIGNVVDVFTLVSTFFGIATSLGLGVMQLNAGLVHLGILKESNFLFQVMIIVVVLGAAIASAAAGLNKGVKRLSELNLGMSILLMVIVLLLGPTIFILSAFSEGIGNYIGQFINLTFNTFAFESEGREWFTNWTVMYWAWWISWAPFVGLFIARISKGRTIREYILAVLIVPSLFIFLWMTVFGSGAIWIDSHTAGGALSAIADKTDILLFSFFEQFPLAKPLCVLALMMIVIFFVTSADSGILVMNTIASKNKSKSPRWQTVFWGVMLALISLSLLYVGGIQSLQTMTLISALPFGFIMLLLCFSLMKALGTDARFRNAKIPYGSRNWNGDHWKERLGQIITFHKKTDIQRFFSKTVLPAFEELKAELSSNGIASDIHSGKQGKLSIELEIPHDQIWNFKYGVAAEKKMISDYLIEDDNTPDIENNTHYLPVTYFSDGRRGNDIQYLNKEEIIADILREYDRFLNIVADEKKAMIYLDKNDS